MISSLKRLWIRVSTGGYGFLSFTGLLLLLSYLLLLANLYHSLPSAGRKSAFERRGFIVTPSHNNRSLSVSRKVKHGEQEITITRDLGAVLFSPMGITLMGQLVVAALLSWLFLRLVARVLNIQWFDPLLLPNMLLLCGIGVLLISRLSLDICHASPSRFPEALAWPQRHTIILSLAFLCVPLVVLVATFLERRDWYQRFFFTQVYKVPLYFVFLFSAAALSIVVKLAGSNVYGATLAIRIMGVSVQLVELIKPLLVFFMAYFLADAERKRMTGHSVLCFRPKHSLNYLIVGSIVAISGITLLFSKDLGLTLICAAFMFAAAVAGTGEATILIGGIVSLIGAILFITITKEPSHAFTRFQSMVDPFLYNETLARVRWCLAAGGLFGTGLGGGMPETVPVVDSDFILAAVAEEMGLFGLGVVILGMVCLLFRGFLLAILEGETFRKHLAAGIVILLAVQTLVITGGTLGVLPFTGITFPFISRGGMSVLVNALLVGLLIQISGVVAPKPGRIRRPFRGNWGVMNKRLRYVAIIFSVHVIGLWLWGAYLMLYRAADDRNKSFTDRNKLTIVEKLIEEGVFSIKNGRIAIDEENLKPAVNRLPGYMRNRINVRRKTIDYAPLSRLTAQLSIREGKIEIPQGLFSVSNPRKQGLFPFTIIDREGRILAKTDGERRRYPFGAYMFPVVGFSKFGRRLFLEHDARLLVDSLSQGGEDVKLLWLQLKQAIIDLFKGNFKAWHHPTEYRVKLTIDATLQRKAMKALGARRGVIIVMSIRDGALLALASKPTFNPSSQRGRAYWDRIFKDADLKVTHNRAMHDWYPPGSLFKLVTAAAMLEYRGEEAKIRERCYGIDRRLHISDAEYKKNHRFKHGMIGLEEALAQSCNIYFARKAIACSAVLQNMVQRFGINRRISLIPWIESPDMRSLPGHVLDCRSLSQADQIPPECQGNGVSPDTFVSRQYLRQNKGIVARVGFGQTAVDVTPLHMMQVVATIAADGYCIRPILISSVDFIARNGERKTILKAPLKKEKILALNTARRIRKGMMRCYTRGTARESIIPLRLDFWKGRFALRRHPHRPTSVAAKTGTAQASQGGAHAWFGAFAPAYSPKVAVLVLIEHGKSGGRVAGPIGLQMLRDSLNLPGVGLN